ncbi:MAG: BTAD domain-containing putative transcriptional regulator [Gemmatimonadales bacterium]
MPDHGPNESFHGTDMLRLSLLGSIELRTESGEDLRSVLAQPKRLGLLAYLAVEAPDRFIRRDTLLALFWPELDQAQARQSLRSALYFLRQHLGDQVVTSRGAEEVGVSTAALWTDTGSFVRAADGHQAESALALYRGELLAGFHIPDSSPDLDQWMSHTRVDLRRRAAQLAWTMAEQAERDRNQVGAAHWGRRAHDIEADDETSLRRLMELLDRSGDPGGAIRAYDEFAGRLETDLRAEPDPVTQALVQRVRNRRARVSSPASHPATTGRTMVDAAPPAVRPLPPAKPSRRGPVAAGFAFAILLVAVVAALIRREDPPRVSVEGPVMVAAFRNETGDTALSSWGRYAGDWITQGLQNVDRLPVVPWTSALRASEFVDSALGAGDADPVAMLRRETGANTVVTGSYYLINDSLRFRAEVTDARAGRPIFGLSGITVSRDSIEAAIRELGDRLMGGVGLASVARFANDPRFGRQPPRFAAFARYEHGQALYLASDYAAAAVEFERAFALDSGFVTPALEAAAAYRNQRRYPQAESMIRLLAARREGLNEYQGLQLARLEAVMRDDGRAALETLRRGAIVAPNSTLSYNLALQAINMNLPREALRTLERMDPSAALVNTWAPYWMFLAHANHLVGRHQPELDAVRELRTRFPNRSAGLVLLVSGLAALNKTGTIDSVLAADRSTPNTYWSVGAALVTAGEELIAHGHLEGANRYFTRAIEWLETQRRTDSGNRYYREWLATALYQAAKWEAARPIADSLVVEFPDRPYYPTMSALIAARLGDTARATRVLGDPPTQQRGYHLASRARIAAIMGDADLAVALLTEALGRGVSEYQWAHADWRRDFERMIDDPRIRRLLIEGFDGKEVVAR